eukprot:1270911-Rhodomonas_salina.4
MPVENGEDGSLEGDVTLGWRFCWSRGHVAGSGAAAGVHGEPAPADRGSGHSHPQPQSEPEPPGLLKQKHLGATLEDREPDSRALTETGVFGRQAEARMQQATELVSNLSDALSDLLSLAPESRDDDGLDDHDDADADDDGAYDGWVRGGRVDA